LHPKAKIIHKKRNLAVLSCLNVKTQTTNITEYTEAHLKPLLTVTHSSASLSLTQNQQKSLIQVSCTLRPANMYTSVSQTLTTGLGSVAAHFVNILLIWSVFFSVGYSRSSDWIIAFPLRLFLRFRFL